MNTILVVDDMAVFREPIAAALEREGFTTLSAANGAEALKLVRAHQPALILLDLAMPVMDGLTFMRTLFADASLQRPRIILLTAVKERQYVVEAARMGVKDYLLKSSFSLSELIGRVRKVLGEGGGLSNAVTSPGVTAPTPPAGSRPASPSAPGSGNSSPGTPRAAGRPAPIIPAVQVMPPADALKLIKPIILRSEIEALLDQVGELKALSPTLSHVLTLTGRPDCSIEQLAKAIRNDQALTLKVLKLANSAAYSRGEPVDTLHRAVSCIGLSQIRQAVLNIGVMERFDLEGLNERLDSAQFWEHAIATGLIAAEIAGELGAGGPRADVAFTLGLIHDVGRMVYLEAAADKYRLVLETADKLGLPLETVESRMLLVNHADAMDRLLHAWRFPRELINPVALHHLTMGSIRQLAPKMVTEIATLALANRLAHAMLLGCSGNLTIYPTHELASGLRLRGELFSRLQQTIPDQTHDMRCAMLLRASATARSDVRRSIVRQLPQGFNPLFIGSEPDTDAFRIFCDAIRCGDPKATPTCAVVHLAHNRDHLPASQMLTQQETQRRIARLPALVISATGMLELEPQSAAGRIIERCPSPVAITRFVAAIRRLDASRTTAGEAAA